MLRKILGFTVPLVVLLACGGREAGSIDSAGSSGGSGTGSSGSSGAGGSSGIVTSSCNGETFFYCDGSHVSRGCCPANADCAQPASYCDLGGGACTLGACKKPVDAGPIDTPCGPGKTCTNGDVCVVTQAGGGACMQPEDGGLCPDGLPPDPCCNRTTTSYDCKALPASCGGSLACPCAASLCTCGGCGLSEQPNALACGCFYPDAYASRQYGFACIRASQRVMFG